jgi:hypothetical protein
MRRKTMRKKAAKKKRMVVKRPRLHRHRVEAEEAEADPREAVALATHEEGQGKSDSRKFGLVFAFIEFLGCS